MPGPPSSGPSIIEHPSVAPPIARPSLLSTPPSTSPPLPHCLPSSSCPPWPKPPIIRKLPPGLPSPTLPPSGPPSPDDTLPILLAQFTLPLILQPTCSILGRLHCWTSRLWPPATRRHPRGLSPHPEAQILAWIYRPTPASISIAKTFLRSSQHQLQRSTSVPRSWTEPDPPSSGLPITGLPSSGLPSPDLPLRSTPMPAPPLDHHPNEAPPASEPSPPSSQAHGIILDAGTATVAPPKLTANENAAPFISWRSPAK